MPKKRDHLAETTALVAVVRAAVDELSRIHGKPLPQAAMDGLATIERFVTNADVSVEELESARKVYDLVQPDRALNWAQTAIGNLGFFATKARGWQNAVASIMDAATYALSTARGDDSDPTNELERLRTAALSQALEGPPDREPTARVKSAPRHKSVASALKKHLGAEASKALSKLAPIFDPGLRADEAALSALLAKYELPVSAAILRFEERYGGLKFADEEGDEGNDWLVGAYACLVSGAHAVAPGALVPVAYCPSDVICYLDEHGAAFICDTIEAATPSNFAETGDEMLVKLLLNQD